MNIHRTAISILLLGFVSIAACNMDKVTRVSITNNNDYPITFTLKTNNIEKSFEKIAPKEKRVETYIWTNIEKTDGSWRLFVTNIQSGNTDSFAHGYFTNGGLSNYLDAIAEGSELKVRVSE